MIDNDWDIFDPLSDSFQKSVTISRIPTVNFSPQQHLIFENPDLFSNNYSGERRNSDVHFSYINNQVDPRSKSGGDAVFKQLHLNQTTSPCDYKKVSLSPETKKPFNITISHNNQTIQITRKGRFNIMRSSTDGNLLQSHQEPNMSQYHTNPVEQNCNSNDLDLIV